MWRVYGQDSLLRRLEAELREGRTAHAYLLAGPPHVGKMTLAINLAQALNCLEDRGEPCGNCVHCTRIASGQHADVRIVGVRRSGDGPARTVIGIGDVKDALRQVNLNPYEGRRTVVIFDESETMSEEAANSLLKTLEEPPGHVTIMLLTTSEDPLPTTVLSRCRRITLAPAPKQDIVQRLVSEHGVDEDRAEDLARLSRGCYGWALGSLNDEQLLEQREAEIARLVEMCEAGLDARFTYVNEMSSLFSRDRSAVRAVLFLWLSWWRDLLLIKEGAGDYIHETGQSARLQRHAGHLTTSQILASVKRIHHTLDALDQNASARLALEVMMINLPGIPAQATADQGM